MNNFKDFFKDKQGRVVIFQTPNAPIIGWFIFTVLSLLWSNNQPKIQYLLSMLGFGFIFTWAWLEIASGVTPFRRILGLLVLLIVIWFYPVK